MNSDSASLIAAKRAASLLKHRSLRVYSLTGQADGEPLRAIVADDGSTLSYVRSLVSDEEPTIARKGTVSAFAAPRLAGANADIVFVGANCLLSGAYARGGFTLVPKWVRLFLPTVEETYPRLYNFGRQTRKYFKWMLKKTRDEGFECETISDPAWLPGFYSEMYKPYAELRFGELAIVHSLTKVRAEFDRGCGVVVKKDGEPVAGAVVSYRDHTVRIPHFGAAAGNLDAFRDGAAFALDYFVVEWAHSSGFEQVDFGHSRPFLSDGVLRYKLNWHMDVVDDDDSIGVFAIATPGQTPAARRFLAAKRFYRFTPKGLQLSDGAEVEESADECE